VHGNHARIIEKFGAAHLAQKGRTLPPDGADSSPSFLAYSMRLFL
jgi:hypothetical protein